MKLKEWLEKAKRNKCEYIKVYYTKYEGTYERDKNGKPYITKKWVNKPINYKDNEMYLECDVVQEEIVNTQATDPIYGGIDNIVCGYCWLDNDQVKLVMKGMTN